MENDKLKPVASKHSAVEIAECLLWLADKEEQAVPLPEGNGKTIKDGVTNLKLQKLMFFAQAAHLALFDKPLFEDDFQAWALGPVLPDLYNKYRVNVRDPIPTPPTVSNDEELKNFLDQIWKIFGKYTASELVNISHLPGSPWYNAFQKGNNSVISQEEMKQYYKDFFRVKENAK